MFHPNIVLLFIDSYGIIHIIMEGKKVLIVIPAHNEEKNIRKVIFDIRKNIKGMDILVINDGSTDRTEEVLIEENVPHINNIFNLGYAMSIQTGIKYAQQKNYDFVIQMDADGQHLASEAGKLFNYAKEHTGIDITIGSRYIAKTGYKCPMMRKIGTKVFEFLIRVFCGKKIADPLSGFQCLNKKVINEYANSDNYPEYPDANLLMEMLYKGYKIHEVPVKMAKREYGESMHGGIIKPIKYMVHMFYAIIIIFFQNLRRRPHE